MKNKEIIIGGDEKTNRIALENKKVEILVSPEKNDLKDKFNYRNSGLNQVLCRIASKNKVSIGFDFCLILRNTKLQRAKYIGRMVQNVKLCRKYRVSMIIGCFSENAIENRSLSTLKAFSKIIGIKSGEAKFLESFKY